MGKETQRNIWGKAMEKTACFWSISLNLDILFNLLCFLARYSNISAAGRFYKRRFVQCICKTDRKINPETINRKTAENNKGYGRKAFIL